MRKKYNYVLQICCVLLGIIAMVTCSAPHSSTYVLNDGMERLSHKLLAEEIVEVVEFFIDNIVNKFATNEGIAYEQLRNSSSYQSNSRFIKRALLDLEPTSLTDIESRRAFFINIYNILVLDGMLSLPMLPSSLQNFSKFEEIFCYKIGNNTFSLAAIFHGILRDNNPDSNGKVYLSKKSPSLQVPKDPRVLFALFNGFRKGLFSFMAYKKETMDKTLNDITIRACNQGVASTTDTSLIIDDIFKTYMGDFASSEEGLLRWLSKCVDDNNKKIALYFASIDQNILKHTFKKTIPTVNSIMMPSNDDKVNVVIYMESLCTDVHDFFLQQLEPAWRTSSSLMNINIIPFGKGSVTTVEDGEKFIFECQNGPQECRGNMLKSCIIAYYTSDLYMPVMTCSMSNPDLIDIDLECSKKLGLPLAPIRECSESIEGSKLLYENGQRTLQLKPKLFYVPTITINGFYNSSSLRNALKTFPEMICDKFAETSKELTEVSNLNHIDLTYVKMALLKLITTPPGCRVKLELYIEAMNPGVQRFFKDQLFPTWKRVGNSIDLRIIPFGNSTIDGDLINPENMTMKCPRGPLECYGNVMMSCIIDTLPVDEQMKLFVCIFSKKIIPYKGEECALSEGIDWKPINSCTEGSLGRMLMKQNGMKTASLTPELAVVPTVVINKVHNVTFSEWALYDLLALVCDSFILPNQLNTKITLPKGCPVRVEIYFELLCPDTNRFFLKVFYPAWKKISHLIDLHLVPFGKANVWLNDEGTDYEFECHFGPLECQGNKIMSCVVEYLPANLQVEFIVCMMRDKSSANAGQTCADSLNIAWEPLSECSNSKEGSDLLFQNGVRTMNLKPNLFFVPTITINGFYDADQLETSLNVFDSQICEAYLGHFSHLEQTPTPKGCRLQVHVYFATASLGSQTFILNQLLPTLTKLGQSSISIDLIALGSDLVNMTPLTDPKRCYEDKRCSTDLMFVCVASNYDLNSQLQLLKCIFADGTTYEAGKKCSQKLGISWDKISRCYQGGVGFNLLNHNIQRAIKLRPKFHALPTVTLNGFYNKSELKKSLENFIGQVCDSFHDPTELSGQNWKPRGCPVTVDVYLESLCPDTKWFFQQQVSPTWKKLHSIMNLNIIPFGKASAKLINPEKDEYSFTCQNGPLECHGNKVISCIVRHYDVHSQVKILECMLAKQFPAVEGRECAEELGLPWDPLLNCIDKDGSKLLYENGLKTAKVRPKIFFIPTATINGFYNKAVLRQSFKDLTGLVCEEYLRNDGTTNEEVIIPEGCKVNVAVFFNSLEDKMKFLFSNEIEEVWKIYGSIIQLRFVPLYKNLDKFNSTEIISSLVNSSPDNYMLEIISCLVQSQPSNIQIEFLACLMTIIDPKDRIKKCAIELKLNMDELDFCATSKGPSLLNENLDLFKKYQKNVSSLPIVVTDKIVLKVHRHLRKLICRQYRGPSLPECDQTSSRLV